MVKLKRKSARRPEPKPVKCICWVSKPKKGLVGWNVKTMWKGAVRQQFFGSSTYGGRRAAYAEAEVFLKSANRELGKPTTERLIYSRSKRNKSGQPGVRRVMRPSGPAWEAYWQPRVGDIQRTCYSVKKHGESGARKLATELRRRKERLLYGREIGA